MEYEAVIGLEVHAQIHTGAKMFCSCPVVEDRGDLSPNTQVCPVCLALPGALPVVNRRAVEFGILAGLALNCTINRFNVFARKSYFYPDLPKGYQISQYELPLASHGALEIEVGGRPRTVGITRAHLEEDTAKLTHTDEGVALVDFNRAGVPLLEIVSEPDMHTVEEVLAYATALREVLIYLGLNTGDLEKGMMRFEANVSVRPRGSETLGTRVEIKNLNSFRALTQSVEYEIARQIDVQRQGGAVAQQTVGWDEARGETYPQRSKEYAHDYRYFPEPDIPPLELDPAWIAALQDRVPELPLARRRRLVAQYDIRPYDAALLVEERAVADYFETAAKVGQEMQIAPQEVANWITGELFRILHERDVGIAASAATPEHLAALLFLLQKNSVSTTAAKTVLEEIFETGEFPNVAVRRLGLAQITDSDVLEGWVQDVLDAHPEQVQTYLAGKTGLLGWFVGQVMQASQGKADPKRARALLAQALEAARDVG
jgi:aspartyl-tRNA(Asn)/glutamyl-tRNA(Gln) amidotransferase subunit B